MIDDQIVLRVERLRDEVELFRTELRDRYPSGQRSVASEDFRERAASIAERWLVEVAGRQEVADAIGGDEVAQRSVHFQRLLTYSERATLRKKYDESLNAILRDFRGSVVIPLKARRYPHALPHSTTMSHTRGSSIGQTQIIFLGQSFATQDQTINSIVNRLLTALGFTVLTGEKPRAATVSRKVRDRIEQSDVFVGVFTRRDKIEGKLDWATSPWIIDEKAYALAKGKRLVLLREEGVSSIGGLQGDYEYLQFDRTEMADVLIRLVETFLNRE